MSSNLTQKQIESLKNNCSGLASWLKTDKGSELIKKHRDHEAWFKEKMSRGNLKTLSSKEFGDIYKRLWASNNWTNKDWAIKHKLIDPNTIENIRTSLSKLLYGDASINIRYNEFRASVKGFGPSSLSEMLHFVFPDKYCLWNDKPKTILQKLELDILPEKFFKRPIKNGAEYSECVRVLGSIKDAMRSYGILDFIDLDIMFLYLHSQEPMGEELLPRLPYHQMIREAINNTGGTATNKQIKDYIISHYRNTNENTINSQILSCSVNKSSRVNFPENQKPRKANRARDFLFSVGRGKVTFYKPEIHGNFEILIRDGNLVIAKNGDVINEPPNSPDPPDPPDMRPYSIKAIINEGCFVKDSKLQSIMNMLESKKNLILQGPPGTGKTYLAKRLAFALVGHKPDSRVRVVQFHPNLSYEDFVRGWRPSGSNAGGNVLDLVDGPFLKMIEDAKMEPERKFVMVIEEINRGNPANIFGEMLTLLEADKRKPEEALILSYMRDGEEQVYIPDNLYVIGTMNVADRSIALVDLALRRRFYFYDLEPVFDKTWKDWVRERCGMSATVSNRIEKCMEDLNQTIGKDGLLGPHFKLGHSYVTPNGMVDDPEEWFKGVASSEIKPLLDEYWVEEPDKARAAMDKLLKMFDNQAGHL